MAAIGRTSPHARALRRAATRAETMMWFAVRDRRLGGFKFRRQATVGPFVVDLPCVEARLAVEIDGGQHEAEREAGRTAFLRGRGLRVIRFWNNDVTDNLAGVLEVLGDVLEEQKKKNPHPALSRKRERE